jgi:Zn-dependent M16 (insulinase) family peptidase
MLKQRQNEEQDQSVLPTLKLTDIAKPPRKLAALTNTLNSLTKTFKQYHVAIEEVVNFYRLVFTFQELDPDFEKRLLLWMYAINRNISTSSYSYNQLAAKLSTHTAGFNVFSTLGQSNDLHVVF